MTSFNLDDELHLFYVTAISFPEGIMDAFTRLEDTIGGKSNRVFFGLSKPLDLCIKCHCEEQRAGSAFGRRGNLHTLGFA